MGVVDTLTSQGCNFCIQSLFGALNTPLEISIRGIQLLCEKHRTLFHFGPHFPKKCCLGTQNDSGSSRPEKLLKIVNYLNCQKIVLS
jgi:hypothetical protein